MATLLRAIYAFIMGSTILLMFFPKSNQVLGSVTKQQFDIADGYFSLAATKRMKGFVIDICCYEIANAALAIPVSAGSSHRSQNVGGISTDYTIARKQ